MSLKKGTENPEENANTSEKATVSNDELIAVVQRMQKEIALLKGDKLQAVQGGLSVEDVVKLIRSASTPEVSRTLDYQAGIEDKDIPLEDFDEKGIVFCAPFVGYCLVDDTRKGHRIVLPYNKPFIFFDHQGTRRFQQGKYQQTASFCTYTSRSKREQEWIRNHSLFNTMFYENSNKAMSFDITRAQKLARIMNILKDFELISLVQRAKEYEVPVSQDILTLRTSLAFAMVDRELASEKSAKQKVLDSSSKEAALLS